MMSISGGQPLASIQKAGHEPSCDGNFMLAST